MSSALSKATDIKTDSKTACKHSEVVMGSMSGCADSKCLMKNVYSTLCILYVFITYASVGCNAAYILTTSTS